MLTLCIHLMLLGLLTNILLAQHRVASGPMQSRSGLHAYLRGDSVWPRLRFMSFSAAYNTCATLDATVYRVRIENWYAMSPFQPRGLAEAVRREYMHGSILPYFIRYAIWQIRMEGNPNLLV